MNTTTNIDNLTAKQLAERTKAECDENPEYRDAVLSMAGENKKGRNQRLAEAFPNYTIGRYYLSSSEEDKPKRTTQVSRALISIREELNGSIDKDLRILELEAELAEAKSREAEWKKTNVASESHSLAASAAGSSGSLVVPPPQGGASATVCPSVASAVADIAPQGGSLTSSRKRRASTAGMNETPSRSVIKGFTLPTQSPSSASSMESNEHRMGLAVHWAAPLEAVKEESHRGRSSGGFSYDELKEAKRLSLQSRNTLVNKFHQNSNMSSTPYTGTYKTAESQEDTTPEHVKNFRDRLIDVSVGSDVEDEDKQVAVGAMKSLTKPYEKTMVHCAQRLDQQFHDDPDKATKKLMDVFKALKKC